MKIYLLLIILFLSACSSTRENHSQKLLNNIKKNLQKNYSIEYGHLIAVYDLIDSNISQNIYATDYGHIINEDKYNRAFLTTFSKKYKSNEKLNQAVKIKIIKINNLMLKLNKQYNFLSKHEMGILQDKTGITSANAKPQYSYFKKLHRIDKIMSSIPVMLPENLHNLKLTSHYGMRKCPIKRKQKFHRGIDLAGPKSAAIYASADGVVTAVKRMNGYGNVIDIKHTGNFSTRYAHLAKIFVRTGDKIIRGNKIALQGNSGNSTSEHLHFEIFHNNKHINPYKFIHHDLYKAKSRP